MATERQAPDALISSTGFSACALSDLTSDPDSGDANWCVASDNNTNNEVHTSFGSPTGNPTVGADQQEFRAEVRQFDGGQTGTPTARIELWENGSLVRAGSEVNVTSATSQVIAFTWNANELATADGSLVECKVIGTKAGGSPSARNSVDVGGVEWNVTYDAAQNVTGSGTPQADTATASGSAVSTNLGSGTAQADTATASGVGVNVDSGSGVPQAETATASGAGLNTNLGSGSPQAATATASGEGTVEQSAVTGSGSPQAETATSSGAAVTKNSGLGSVQANPAVVSVDANVIHVAFGSSQAADAQSSGVGKVVYLASGTPQAERATANGTGSVSGGAVYIKYHRSRLGLRLGL